MASPYAISSIVVQTHGEANLLQTAASPCGAGSRCGQLPRSGPRLCNPGLLSSGRPSLSMHPMRPDKGHGRARRLSLSPYIDPGDRAAQRRIG